MSSQGGRQAPGQGGGGNPSGSAAARRLGLLIFGAGFLVLFVIVAISEGVGDPSIPSGDVAVVEDAPGDVGEVTQAEFDHALELAAVQTGEEKPPKPGDPKYNEVREVALDALFESIWLQGQAAEWGIEVSDGELAEERKKLENESFKSEKEFNEFLKESGYNNEDVDERVRLQVLSTQLQEALARKAPDPSKRQIEDYYEAAKATQFTQKPTRDVRLIVNKSRKKAKEALVALSGDNTEENWKKVAKELSEDPTTKEKGGLQEAVQEGTLEEPLDAAVFNAPEGRVEGPVDAQRGFIVFEVTNSNPESVQELEAVEKQIEGTLTQQLEQEYFASFLSSFTYTWTGRTFCDSDYTTQRCSNFKGDGHAAAAPPACYEENPEGGLPEACPAPVPQLVPALPGSVTPLVPKGKPLAQRPRPVGGATPPAGAEGLEGLPEGAVPPPAEEAPPPEPE